MNNFVKFSIFKHKFKKENYIENNDTVDTSYHICTEFLFDDNRIKYNTKNIAKDSLTKYNVIYTFDKHSNLVECKKINNNYCFIFNN